MTAVAFDCWHPQLHADRHHMHPDGRRVVCLECHPPAALLTGDWNPDPPDGEQARHATVELWTDGASSPDGCGGWAFILVALDSEGEVLKRIDGAAGEADTTNNRMELQAVIQGLRSLHRPTAVTVYSDSAYVVNAFLENWFARWERDNWTRKVKGHGRQEVANQDLWRELRAVALHHQVTWEHIRGHAGHALNEQCDVLAVAAKHAIQAERKVAA